MNEHTGLQRPLKVTAGRSLDPPLLCLLPSLPSADQFMIPAGNTYQLENKSGKHSVKLYFVLVKPSQVWMNEAHMQQQHMSMEDEEQHELDQQEEEGEDTRQRGKGKKTKRRE